MLTVSLSVGALMPSYLAQQYCLAEALVFIHWDPHERLLLN